MPGDVPKTEFSTRRGQELSVGQTNNLSRTSSDSSPDLEAAPRAQGLSCLLKAAAFYVYQTFRTWEVGKQVHR